MKQRIQRRRHNKTLVSKGLLATLWISGTLMAAALSMLLVDNYRLRQLTRISFSFEAYNSNLDYTLKRLTSIEQTLSQLKLLQSTNPLWWQNLPKVMTNDIWYFNTNYGIFTNPATLLKNKGKWDR